MPSGPVFDPIQEQRERNAQLMREAGVSAAHVGGGGVEELLSDDPGNYGSVQELFLSSDNRGTPPDLDPDEDRKREEEARRDLGLPAELGNTLHLSSEDQALLAEVLEDADGDMALAALTYQARKEMDKSQFVFPDKAPGSGSYPIPDLAHARNALARASGKPEEEQVKAAVYKKFPQLRKDKQQTSQGNPEPDLALADEEHVKIKCPECGFVNSARSDKCVECKHDLSEAIKAEMAKLSQEDESHAASFYDRLSLAEKRGDDGLVWKAICKTGTLALSPGPGQIDVEKPLELTPKLFEELKTSVDEKAFPHITVPTTHNNGLLDNTGYVRKVQIEDSKDPADPPGTKVLMAGIEFTEPEIKEKVLNGTIPDTSVGVKFNYRNKRTGKLYPAALEHVALTHQPWVDGLTPFGQALSQEGVFDQEEAEPDWDGVYMHAAQEGPSREEPKDSPSGDILPKENGPGTVPTVSDATTKKDLTVERLMAAQQARQEALEQENEKLRQDLSLAQGTADAAIEQLHASTVASKIQALEGKLPPALLTRIEAVYLADKPTSENSLNLSLAGAGEDGANLEIGSASQLVDFLLAGLPIASSDGVASLVLNLSQQASQRPEEKDAGEKADEIYKESGLAQERPTARKKGE